MADFLNNIRVNFNFPNDILDILVVAFIVVGSTLKVNLVWELSDFFNGLMVIPNLLALLALSGVVAVIDKE